MSARTCGFDSRSRHHAGLFEQGSPGYFEFGTRSQGPGFGVFGTSGKWCQDAVQGGVSLPGISPKPLRFSKTDAPGIHSVRGFTGRPRALPERLFRVGPPAADMEAPSPEPHPDAGLASRYRIEPLVREWLLDVQVRGCSQRTIAWYAHKMDWYPARSRLVSSQACHAPKGGEQEERHSHEWTHRRQALKEGAAPAPAQQAQPRLQAQ
jgi:hypothetical protein